jgi:2-dehydro-3-deoxygluconokinase
MLKLRPNSKTAIMTASSMGLRLTPPNGQPFHTADSLDVQVTSAETNVVSVASHLGMPAKVLSKFVKDSPVSKLIRSNLAARGIEVEGPEVDQDGPWGLRHQINMADSGFGSRGPRVWNDRAGEVGRTLSVDDFDLERIFGEEGVQIVHLSGLIAALSPDTGTFCLELARAAKKHGTLISFDLNHRATFWEGREKELHDIFTEIASVTDILVGNEEDFQLCLGVEGPEAGGEDLAAKINSFKGMINRAKEMFPHTTMFATTLREVVHVNNHKWGCILSSGDEWQVVEPRDIYVLDRIGGGDGFVGGMLYGILKGWDAEQCAQFGWASGALAATLLTDYGTPADEDQVWSIWKGNARVKR